jgi:hypothetical protein
VFKVTGHDMENEVSKTPTTKNSMFVMAASKQFVVDYILKSPLQGEKNHFHGTSLKVVMHTFSIIGSLHCRNFVAVSNWDRVP